MKQAIVDLIVAVIELIRKPKVESPSPAGIVEALGIEQLIDGTVTIKGIPKKVWLTTVANTNSMLPVIDYGDVAILTSGFNHSELKVGDIFVYHAHQSIIHRIVDIQDSDIGRVYTARGDNNAHNDSYQILDEHITWLLVGIIYCKKD